MTLMLKRVSDICFVGTVVFSLKDQDHIRVTFVTPSYVVWMDPGI